MMKTCCGNELLELSDEEFKVEAKRRGYNLIKIPEKVKLLPCVCGGKKLKTWYVPGKKQFYECPNCGLRSEPATMIRQMNLNWNKMIEEVQNERNDS